MSAKVVFIFMRGNSNILEVGEVHDKNSTTLVITKLNTANPAKNPSTC